MWNDPNLDQSTSAQTDSRDKRNRGRRDKEKEKDEELIAFGYEAFLFPNDGVAEAIEQGHLLITWQGQDPNDEDSLWLDRYDVRNLLDDERLFRGIRDIQHENFLQESSDLEEERFEDLDSDEEQLFDMDEDEREEHLARKREENETTDYKGVRYEYDQTNNVETQEPTFKLHFEVPEGMPVPDSEKILALIERTAKFVNNSSEPTMEIILQAKQATNPNFAFMSRRHQLFQFYKHVRWLMKTGLYETAEEARLREAEEAKIEQEEEEARAAEAARALEACLHFDIEQVIDNTISFLNLHAETTTVFEDKLKSIDDPRFEFMKPDHIWHEYYLWKRRKAQEAEIRARDANAGAGADIVDANATTLFLSHMEEKTGASLQEIRAAEMRRLDRLQRVKELFKHRHKNKKESDAEEWPSTAEPGQEQENHSSDEMDIDQEQPRLRRGSRSRSESRSPSRSRSHSGSSESSMSQSSSRSWSGSRPGSRSRSRSDSPSSARKHAHKGHE